MIIYVIRSILQNLIMGLPGVQAITEPLHSTGMHGNTQAAHSTFERFGVFVDVTDKDVLDIGPGQTPEVLGLAKAAGARACKAVDIHVYLEAARAKNIGIEIQEYDGVHLPFADASFDIIWSNDVFEHVRAPEALVCECARVLRTNGLFLARIDLRDHYFLNDELRWLECLKYSDRLWHLMTSNRTAYVNRLRSSDWMLIFKRIGFRIVSFEARRSDVLTEAFVGDHIHAQHALTAEDASIYAFDCVYQKV